MEDDIGNTRVSCENYDEHVKSDLSDEQVFSLLEK